MKNLIHEIHRRSLWQVLGIYLAGSWIALQVIDVLGSNMGLPEWVGPTAIALLLICLPVVVATAFVQEGMTTKVPEAPRQSLADVGEVPPLPAPELEGRHRIFTWKNALIGVGAAFALLGVLTAGYLFMRSSGIGPAGTLVAQGVLDEGAKVVLADFESTDPDLADVVSSALRVDLLQSPTIRIVQRAELGAALERMQLPEGARVTGPIALELATREGYGAVIQGEIGTAGAGYVLTASIVGGENGSSLAAFKSTARSEDELIDAIERLSRDIRDKSGESLRSVTNSPALQRVTTGSMEALRTYTRAETLEGEGDREGALQLYERAVEIDPDFAMAHRKVAVLLRNMGIRPTDGVAALRRSYELRDRLPETEAYLAEAYFESSVRGDRRAAIRAYERLLELDPDNTSALNNLALLYADLDRLDEAEGLLEHALAITPFQVGFSNLAVARYVSGDVEGSNAVLDLGIAEAPGTAPLLESTRLTLAMWNDLPRAEQLLEAYDERFQDARSRVTVAVRRYMLDALHGRLDAAEGRISDFDLGPSVFGHPIIVSYSRNWLAVFRGDVTGALRDMLNTVRDVRERFPPAERYHQMPIRFAAVNGAAGDAEAMLEEWKRDVSEDELGLRGRDARRESTAWVAFARGDYDAAVREWESHERECPGACDVTASLGLAMAHDAAGRPDAAIAEYERFLVAYGPRVWSELPLKPVVMERLGRLYSENGDVGNAIRHLEAFVDLWAGADPELQPRVQAARETLAGLQRASA